MKVCQYIQLTGETVQNENKLQLILDNVQSGSGNIARLHSISYSTTISPETTQCSCADVLKTETPIASNTNTGSIKIFRTMLEWSGELTHSMKSMRQASQGSRN